VLVIRSHGANSAEDLNVSAGEVLTDRDSTFDILARMGQEA